MAQREPEGQERECLSCAIVEGRIVTVGGVILETPHFQAHQDFKYPIPGFVILATKRHVRGWDELTLEEACEYGVVLQRLRQAQRRVLGVEIVYTFNNEDTRSHFHTWMLPRYDWMNAFGRFIESVRPAVEHAREHRSGLEELERVRHSVERLRDALRTDAA
jgi:diadenosine tetraphosphate (Ap4A) HIT family hydrolase